MKKKQIKLYHNNLKVCYYFFSIYIFYLLESKTLCFSLRTFELNVKYSKKMFFISSFSAFSGEKSLAILKEF